MYREHLFRQILGLKLGVQLRERVQISELGTLIPINRVPIFSDRLNVGTDKIGAK